MNIDEAITLLLCAKEGFPLEDTELYYKAMELGIEALKLYQRIRIAAGLEFIYHLPGETE